MWLNFLFDRPKMIELNSTNYTIWKLLMKLLYDIYFGWEDFWVAYLCVRWKNIWLPTSRIRKFGLISRVKYDRINLHKLYNLKGPHEACHMVVIFGVRRLSGCLFMCKIFGLYFFSLFSKCFGLWSLGTFVCQGSNMIELNYTNYTIWKPLIKRVMLRKNV